MHDKNNAYARTYAIISIIIFNLELKIDIYLLNQER